MFVGVQASSILSMSGLVFLLDGEVVDREKGVAWVDFEGRFLIEI